MLFTVLLFKEIAMSALPRVTLFRKIRPSSALLLATALLLGACATQPAQGSPSLTPPAQTPPTQTPPTQTPPGQTPATILTPTRLVFSSAKTTLSLPQTLTLVNSGTQSLGVNAVSIAGPDAAAFVLDAPLSLPLALEAGKTLTLALRFGPQDKVGVLNATLRLETADRPLTLSLAGLSAGGLEGENEPPLAQVVQALGYGTDVGGSGLLLGTSPSRLGQEVDAQMFRKAGAGPVTLTPVARYSPAGPLEFGLFTLSGGTPALRPVGEIDAQQFQTLNPAFRQSGVSFDPGSENFGVYTGATGYSRDADYTLDSLNASPKKDFNPPVLHAMRVYPLFDEAGARMPGYLVAVEASSNGDYQDAVFMLNGAEPAPTAP